MTLPKEVAEQIQLHGANARARGESMLDNPYLKREAMPALTGDGIKEWTAKHDAWELGWRCEDMMNPSALRTRSTQEGDTRDGTD